jgi:hypothetical protein
MWRHFTPKSDRRSRKSWRGPSFSLPRIFSRIIISVSRGCPILPGLREGSVFRPCFRPRSSAPGCEVLLFLCIENLGCVRREPRTRRQPPNLFGGGALKRSGKGHAHEGCALALGTNRVGPVATDTPALFSAPQFVPGLRCSSIFMHRKLNLCAARAANKEGAPEFIRGEERFSAPEKKPPTGSGLMIQPGEMMTRFRALCVPMVYIGKRWAPTAAPR